jgi:hypothetical protein
LDLKLKLIAGMLALLGLLDARLDLHRLRRLRWVSLDVCDALMMRRARY